MFSAAERPTKVVQEHLDILITAQSISGCSMSSILAAAAEHLNIKTEGNISEKWLGF